MPRKSKRPIRKLSPTLFILAGITLLLVAIFGLKSAGDSSTPSASLEAELDQALSAKRPTFVFLHSLDCIPCKEMMGVVADVYPDFQGSVTLIDVDIYDQRNTNILRREGLQSIPTLIFYDTRGNRQMHIGVLSRDQLRQVLTGLAAGQ